MESAKMTPIPGAQPKRVLSLFDAFLDSVLNERIWREDADEDAQAREEWQKENERIAKWHAVLAQLGAIGADIAGAFAGDGAAAAALVVKLFLFTQAGLQKEKDALAGIERAVNNTLVVVEDIRWASIRVDFGHIKRYIMLYEHAANKESERAQTYLENAMLRAGAVFDSAEVSAMSDKNLPDLRFIDWLFIAVIAMVEICKIAKTKGNVAMLRETFSRVEGLVRHRLELLFEERRKAIHVTDEPCKIATPLDGEVIIYCSVTDRFFQRVKDYNEGDLSFEEAVAESKELPGKLIEEFEKPLREKYFSSLLENVRKLVAEFN